VRLIDSLRWLINPNEEYWERGWQMRWMAAISVVLFGHLAACCTSAFAAGPYQKFQSDNWSGGAYTDDTTRTFSHCAASTAYRSNILFFVAVNRSMQWNLGFLRPDWNLKTGEVIPVTSLRT
jgi:hypothetical protein